MVATPQVLGVRQVDLSNTVRCQLCQPLNPHTQMVNLNPSSLLPNPTHSACRKWFRGEQDRRSYHESFTNRLKEEARKLGGEGGGEETGRCIGLLMRGDVSRSSSSLGVTPHAVDVWGCVENQDVSVRPLGDS